MLKFGNKEFRNLQEQVEENMKNIESLKSGQAVLDEFGIKVVGEVESIDDMPTVAEYKEAVPDWEYGDAYAVGTQPPYTMYILTRANGTHEADYWFNIGVFPEPGPQGEQGPQGPEGPQGQTGNTGPTGASAGFGTPTASVTQYSRGTQPAVSVEASGPNTEKIFSFEFGIPSGAPSVTLTSTSGTLTLSQFNMLQDQPDSVILQRVSAGAAIVFYTLQRWYKSEDYMYFICLYNYTPNRTSFRVCQVDLHNRKYTLTSDVAMKVGRYNISSYDPDISGNATSGKVLTADGSGGVSWTSGPSFTQVQSDWTQSNSSEVDYIKNKPSLSTVATSGSYNDLTDKPTIPTVDYPVVDVEVNGTSVVSNKIADITVPTNISDLNNDSGYITGITSSDVTTALGYTPYDSSNPNGYTSNVGTVTSVGVSVPTGLTVSNTPITSSGTIAIGLDTGYVIPTQTSLNNYVTLDTQQTISANKTFSSGITLSNGSQIYMNGPLGDNCGVISCSGSVTSADSSIGIIGQDKIEFKRDGSLYSLVVPNTNYFSSDKTIATTDDIPTITITTTSGSESVSDGTNILSFGSNAFNSTSIPSVSGTNDGTNWTALTINSDTYNIPSGGGSATDVQVNGTSITSGGVANIVTEGTYNASTNKIATMSDIPSSSNFVDLTSAQTITGVKTFNDDVVIRYPGELTFKNGLGVAEGHISANSGLLIEGPTKFQTTNLNNYSVIVPSTFSYTADKTIATTSNANGTTEETWTFTLANGNTVTKTVILG